MVILVIVSPDRFENYQYLSSLTNDELIFLWHTNPNEMQVPLNSLPKEFNKIIFWNQFRTPCQLLEKIKPHKIVFFEIIDLRQISLIISAKAKKITTFYVDHGAAGDNNTAISRWNEVKLLKHKVPYLLKRLKRLPDVVKSKRFYYSVSDGFDSRSSYLKYLKLPFLMLSGASNKALAHCKFRERVPTYSLVFNRANFEQLKGYTGISESDAIFTGIPFFDKYYDAKYVEKDHVTFIDQPFLESEILEWTTEHHKKVATAIFDFAEKYKTKVYIKLHPRSKMEYWQHYIFNEQFVQILQEGDYTDLFLKSKLIIGYSSSLITAFLCARKNVVLIGWHPHPAIFGADFSDTGLCHKSLSPSDLDLNYDKWVNNNLAIDDETAYLRFLMRFNYPFDGHATDRVLKAITGEG